LDEDACGGKSMVSGSEIRTIEVDMVVSEPEGCD
jgi:hypothetical protein